MLPLPHNFLCLLHGYSNVRNGRVPVRHVSKPFEEENQYEAVAKFFNPKSSLTQIHYRMPELSKQLKLETLNIFLLHLYTSLSEGFKKKTIYSFALSLSLFFSAKLSL
ncbi:hypothetical protein AAZX31_02G091300 [Glycine max]|uniref:Uncharacterized protein n=2 Tax=Glycine subgen. Soja TaxID=1462606 RepID=K7K7D7_SOYBN|nr:hypothetical protein GLYMA_02G096700v4 [Glycine max]RZC24207.1 hypothetical protein D0Y65_003458 [Glycine soja]KAG5062636.1 hypothetical protein JHK85_003819 [Glycine max]KAG5079590.1 hypothetical protein JHK86_003655 [Glycine max]KAH1059575.1 hypothetical protein GYH30_003534 [Glycine max]